MAHITDMYSLAHERMIASVTRSPSASSSKFSAASDYGPYHAQYWSLVENDLTAGTPLQSNGSYHSPYSSLAPDVLFSPSTPGATVATYNESADQNGYDHPDGSAYTLGRSAQFATCMPPETANVYPSPVDNFSWNYFPVDASPQNLSNLESLSSQILGMLLTHSVDDFAAMVARPDLSTGRAFGNLEAMFDQIKQQLPLDASNRFIDVSQLQLSSSSGLGAIRKANLAVFATSIFRGRDVPFADLNDRFLDIFMPSGTCLLKNEGSLFLELKTQAFLAMTTSHSYPRELVDQLFPRDLQLTLLRRRADPQYLAATEQDFIGRYNARRQLLITCCDDVETLSQLPSKYSWSDFLDELRTCVGRNLDYLERTKGSTSAEDAITKAALAAHAAISGHSPNGYHSPSLSQTSNFGHKRKRSPGSDSSLSPETPHAPIHLQYRRTASHASSKSQSPFTSGVQRRLANPPSTRRPWTPEEEKALMEGLERVKGPHWSQILALYGANGSISEILKDRNQVQLKDKARNLKLFFLKSGLEVPYFLQKVTGELKTRAPAQAAKLEARERLKRLEEQRAGGNLI
ncbi:hypothetical protein, variant [Verruconis gallopava]|nr:hypothetical protein, variant [Verruconis gallopava]KIW06540.1 hypothetical protein, variant [Verruconis gallopava]